MSEMQRRQIGTEDDIALAPLLQSCVNQGDLVFGHGRSSPTQWLREGAIEPATALGERTLVAIKLLG